jgi:flagellar motility protein MotE (MotC chaperone)
MIRLLRDFRLIPIVLIATGCLFGLKVVGLFFNGGYVLGPRGVDANNIVIVPLASSAQELSSQTVTLDGWAAPANGKQSWMREIFGFPDVTGSINPSAQPSRDTVTVTGSSGAPAPKDKPAPDKAAPQDAKSKPPETTPPIVNGTQIQLDNNRQVSTAERAILERLLERRQELDKRARELDMRENMLKEAEAKLDIRMNELKMMETQAGGGVKKKEEAEASRFKNLATMYENMKAKDAAKIFDRLDIKILLDMTAQINPRRMSDIMAQMSPEAAERLTVELASKASGVNRPADPSNLPKIEGRPNGT